MANPLFPPQFYTLQLPRYNAFVVMWQSHLCAQCIVIAIAINVAVNLCVCRQSNCVTALLL